MKKSFDSFLKSHYSKKGEAFTHTRIGDKTLGISGGAYTIKNTEEFHKKYYKHVFEGGNYEFLTEKQHTDSGPICIDLDFRYAVDIEEKQHNENDITNIISLYFDEISSLLDIPNDTSVPVFIFEKEDVNMLEDVTKDGIHIIIGINMDRILQIMLRKRVINNLSTTLESLPLIKGMEDVVDETITNGTTNWQLYGSRKPGNQPYILKYYYHLKKEDDEWYLEVNQVKDFNFKERFQELSAQYKNHQTFNMLDEVKDEFNKLKTNKTKKSSSKKLKIVDRSSTSINEVDIRNKSTLDNALNELKQQFESKEYILNEIIDYTLCLSEKYYNPYDAWLRVGMALKNTDDRLFIAWVAFSAKSEKFDYDKIDEFYELWMRFDKNNEKGLTFKSIIFWAKDDNYDEYMIIRKQTIDYFVEKTIENPTDWDFANVLYHMYKDKFTCVSLKKDLWYKYVNHKWEENEGGTDLRMSISKELFSIYFTKQSELVSQLGTIDCTSEKHNELKAKAKKIAEISNNLKRRGIKDNIMREAKEIFYDKEFIDKVDSNPRLLCFTNGVIDFTDNTFRNGKPEDYIAKSTGINYEKFDEKKHSTIKTEIVDFMYKLFPDEELRTYMWDHLASTLIGENNDQTFNIYNGNGSNGKSKLVELMSMGLGDYKATVPITLVTTKRNSIGSTSSEVVQLKGIRYAVMQEPSKGDRLNEGIMKEITGGDPLQGRALFKDSITFIPQFKLVVCTNTLLDVNSNDEGTWRRICVCEFKSKFCSQEEFEDDRLYQFEKDKQLGLKFPIWAPVFISILIERAFKTNGLVNICQAVKASSSSYRNTQDYYSEFIADNIKKKPGKYVRQTTLYSVFKEWYQLHHGKNFPKGRDVFDFMNKKFGKSKDGKWKDIIIIEDYDNSDSEDL